VSEAVAPAPEISTGRPTISVRVQGSDSARVLLRFFVARGFMIFYSGTRIKLRPYSKTQEFHSFKKFKPFKAFNFEDVSL
jgi:hypothetical protein